jgi:quercetin dioxygenase-like cupin family protein
VLRASTVVRERTGATNVDTGNVRADSAESPSNGAAMQHVVTGLGPDGRSTVLERRDVTERAHESVVIEEVWRTPTLPPELPQSIAGQGEASTVEVPDIGSRWIVVTWPPNADAYMHRTDTLDFDVVLSGQLTLVLEDGEVVLDAGDSVVIPGVRHGWRAGSDGCVTSAVLLALPRSGSA